METNGVSWVSERLLESNGDQCELLRLLETHETNGDSLDSEPTGVSSANGDTSLRETTGD